MAHQDYSNPTNEVHQVQLPKFEKSEDSSLPGFTKEVPLRSIVKRHGSNIMIEYEWSVLGGEEIRISMATCRKDSNLDKVHKIRIKDGEEVGYFRVDSTTYIIRKTSESIAKELMKTTGKIKASVLEVVGFLKTVQGNFYTISKLEEDAWSMDPRTGLKNFSLERMSEGEKRRFTDLVIDELLKLYRQGYALRNFSISDVIVTRKKVVLGNMAPLAKVATGKRVDGFLGNLKAMVKAGVAYREDITYGLALSMEAMKKEYASWSRDNGLEEKGQLEVLESLETRVLN
ncbi:MAG: hypothetical protein WC488_00300 [Candidatus Micrarchaeia archaeon]